MLKIFSKLYYSNKTGVIAWLIVSLFYSLQMTLRLIPSAMMDNLTREFAMKADDLGTLAGFYYIGYAGMQIPIGVLLDKFHPRYVISFCILICTSGILFTIYAKSISDIYVSRLLIGLGSVGGILGAMKAADDFYPEKYSLLLGITILLGVFGAFYGGAPILTSFQNYGVEKTLLMFCYISLIIAILVLFLYRTNSSKQKVGEQIPFTMAFRTTIFNWKLWACGVLGGLMVGPLGGFGDMWAAKYLQHAKNMEPEYARFASTMVFVGLGLGSTITGYISLRIKSLSKLISIMGGAQFFLMSSLLFLEIKDVITILAIMFFIGALCGYQVNVFSLSRKMSASHMVGLSTSLVNSIIMMFGFIFNFSIGKILKAFFKSSSEEILIYEQSAYQAAFLIILLSIIAGSIGFMLLSRLERKIVNS